MTTLSDIEKQAKRYSEARAAVAEIVSALNEAMDALKRTELPKLRRAIARAAEHHDALKQLIELAPELFTKPRTQTLHGIRLGYMKEKGKLQFDDADRVVALIEKHFPDQVELLIATTKKPVKKALEQLSAAELKRVGITITDAGDAVFIQPTDSAVDKMVDALLKAATEEVPA